MSSSSSAGTVEVTAKWQSSSQTFPFPLSSTVADLHSHIALLFNLAPTLKLIGLVKGKLPPPSALLSSLALSPSIRLSVIGTLLEDASGVNAMDAVFAARRADEERREEDRRRQREMREKAEEDVRRELEGQRMERQRVFDAQRAERDRQWREEQVRMDAERKERELKEEQAGGTVTFTFQCLRGDESDSQQKLILPPSALQRIIDAKAAFPLTFAVKRAERTEAEETKGEDELMEERKDVVYLGVADFTSPVSTVVLVPSSLLKALQVIEGASLTLSTFTLPKATHISLLPLPSASSTPPTPSPFYSLSSHERTALLEFHLRHHQMLTRGQVIDVQYRRGMELMRFEVKDVQPGDVVSIIDADVETEVEGNPIGERGEGERVEGEEVRVGEDVEGDVKKGEYWYGHAALDDVNSEYEVAVSSKGDCDVYVVKRERTSGRPEMTAFDWRGVDVGDDRLVLSNDDPRFSTGDYDIAVHAYDEAAHFRLHLQKRPKTTSTASSSSSLSSSSAVTGETTECSNCHKQIPVKAMTMHSVQCRRINSPCPHCSLVLLTRNLPKHIAMHHTPVPCPSCSQQMELPLLASHRRDTCVGRLVECLYCPLLVTAGERGAHSAEDGLFRSACKECGEVMQRKVMRRHMRQQHGREEKDITWHSFV